MKRLAVFASGSGSNFEAVMRALQEGRLTGAQVALLVCDKPGAYVLERAERFGVPVLLFDPKTYPDKAAYETEIVGRLQALGVELIVLAGYMRLVGPVLLHHYEGRIINLHPSLLPAFPGKDAIGQALAYGVKVTGVTVHFVDAGMDTGPIIAQHPVRVEPADTAETLAARIHEVEHRLLVQVIQALVDQRVAMDGRLVTITEP
ncbi:phosphoribosylglycinamide formyltransferase [Brevibacillus sp. SYP-B805]|uniref:phosphoribosylglycinamide formyltransferase n=1 Tax=Brevibacillus sp. SYP-B805 TaxID=1578199 RepID=UPI0013ED407E|nr:phosphoribosylglycinamide formyltransferase [Brevibacillus sp. SYP-B805]